MKICRCIFGYPFTNRRIRNAGNEVMWASAKKQWDLGKQCSHDYTKAIKQEYDLARKTADVLQNWANSKKATKFSEEQKSLSRKEIAELFGVTVEAVRNWERNGLIFSDMSGSNNEKLYTDVDMERVRVVYMLRQAGIVSPLSIIAYPCMIEDNQIWSCLHSIILILTTLFPLVTAGCMSYQNLWMRHKKYRPSLMK